MSSSSSLTLTRLCTVLYGGSHVKSKDGPGLLAAPNALTGHHGTETVYGEVLCRCLLVFVYLWVRSWDGLP